MAQAPFQGLTAAIEREVVQALDAARPHQAWALMHKLHPADGAELLARLPRTHLGSALDALRQRFDARIMPYLDEPVRSELFTRLGLAEVALAMATLETDDAVDLLADLDDERRNAILAHMPEADRALLARMLTYPEGSAGRLMQLECASVPQQWTVGQTLDFLQHARDLPSALHAAFVVDSEGRPVGAVPLDRLLRARRLERVADVMLADAPNVSALAAQSDVARLFRRYALLSVAVVDGDGRVLGQITIDDVVDVIDPSEGGASPSLDSGGADVAKRYFVSADHFAELLPALAVALPASAMIFLFQSLIARGMPIAAMAPIVVGVGLGAGRQSLARAFRSRLPGILDWGRIGEEITVAATASTPITAIAALAAGIWLESWQAALAIAIAMTATLAVSCLLGSLIPLVGLRMKKGIRQQAGLMLAAATVAAGLLIFFGLVSWLTP
ncbi:MAG: magnesium transporter [Proteobacteria bacterium]|nr:magnesium transporter [Pseudomonadota bacterium]MBI3496725.1 magnesium transporter [Pseudomonadota bacterium]